MAHKHLKDMPKAAKAGMPHYGKGGEKMPMKGMPPKGMGKMMGPAKRGK